MSKAQDALHAIDCSTDQIVRWSSVRSLEDLMLHPIGEDVAAIEARATDDAHTYCR